MLSSKARIKPVICNKTMMAHDMIPWASTPLVPWEQPIDLFPQTEDRQRYTLYGYVLTQAGSTVNQLTSLGLILS